jgi:hypothetical protein
VVVVLVELPILLHHILEILEVLVVEQQTVVVVRQQIIQVQHNKVFLEVLVMLRQVIMQVEVAVPVEQEQIIEDLETHHLLLVE